MLKRLGRAFARLRRRSDEGVSVAAPSAAQKNAAVTLVTVPWRSSSSWDEFDLRAYPHRKADRFQFFVGDGDRISVRVETSLPGGGLRVRLSSGNEGDVPVQASSDEHGVVELLVVARAAGTHAVEVELDPPGNERPRSYRLSIDAPRGRRAAGAARSKAAEFVDVPAGHHYREAVTAVVAAGVMTGAEEWWQFAPEVPVTRVELAEMVRESLGREGSGAVSVLLADLATQDRLKGALRAVPRAAGRHDAQVVVATSGGSSVVTAGARRRASLIARAQAVSLIIRGLERYRPGALRRPPRGFSSTMASSLHSLHVRLAEYNGLMEGLEGFGPQWDPRLAVSRGEVAQMLWASMRLVPSTPSTGAEIGVVPHLTAFGVHADEFLLGTHEEIDRLMAESGADDESRSRGNSYLLGESPSPEVPLALDRVHLRHRVEQTRDRLRAQILGPPPPDKPVQR